MLNLSGLWRGFYNAGVSPGMARNAGKLPAVLTEYKFLDDELNPGFGGGFWTLNMLKQEA